MYPIKDFHLLNGFCVFYKKVHLTHIVGNTQWLVKEHEITSHFVLESWNTGKSGSMDTWIT